MFQAFPIHQSISDLEEQIIKLWQQRAAFRQSVERRKEAKPFVFYEGPPTANGLPGIHHVLARTFKDTICRYQTMKGRYVRRKAGWDTHGLPVELQVEKALGLNSKQAIERYGVAAFNQACRDSVWQYKEDWERLTERMGYWIDLEKPYITYEKEYIESVWWGLKQIWNKDRIYQDYKVVPYCPRCGTALSLAEVAQGYKDVTETSVYIKFKVIDEPDTYILVWTTTPWTLPGNVALAVGKNILYVKIQQGNKIYYISEDRLQVLEGKYKVLEKLTGAQLIGKKYQPLFDFLNLAQETSQTAYSVLAADFVNTEDGTGVVHTAVMYGEEDFTLGKSADLPNIHTVDEAGRFNQLVPPWQGQFVKDAEKSLIEYLKERDLLYKTEQTTHTYPFCWRCGTHLLYYARHSWFIRIDDQVRQRLLELNKNITWVPAHLQAGRFGNWLEGLRDWAISRERYWGTPLSIWICQADNNHRQLIGSLAELAGMATEQSKEKLADPAFDLHKPYIDDIELTCPDCQQLMRRVPEVLDVWLDSGSMPYAQWDYPAHNSEQFKQQFPADYIAEGIDQTRGWFNSLLILSALIFDQTAYRSVISPNLVLDEKGQKMSKSKGNVVDPWTVIAETGSDALRLYFLSVNQAGEYKNFSIKAVQEVYRKTIHIWLNVANYFLTYAVIDQWRPDQTGQATVLDQWVKARVAETAIDIGQALDELDTFRASRRFQALIDDLSTWYLRRSRKRHDPAFYNTFHEALVNIAIISAPICPFLAEATYQALEPASQYQSVHHVDWPILAAPDHDLIEQMTAIRQLVALGHAIRSQIKLKVRQPLSKAVISGVGTQFSDELLSILAEELNVKSIEIGASLPTGWLWLEEAGLRIALDTHLTPELKREGLTREVVRAIQDWRKKAGCQPGESVKIGWLTDSDQLRDILTADSSVGRQTASYLTAVKHLEVLGNNLTVKVDGHSLSLGLLR